MLMLLLPAKFYSVCRNWSQIAKQKFNNFRPPVFRQTNFTGSLFWKLKMELFTFIVLSAKLDLQVKACKSAIVCAKVMKLVLSFAYFNFGFCRPQIQSAILFLPIEICPQVYTDKNSTGKSRRKLKSLQICLKLARRSVGDLQVLSCL